MLLLSVVLKLCSLTKFVRSRVVGEPHANVAPEPNKKMVLSFAIIQSLGRFIGRFSSHCYRHEDSGPEVFLSSKFLTLTVK